MITYAPRRPQLAQQLAPALAPSLAPAFAPAPAGNGATTAVVIGGLIGLGMAATGVLFNYGVARESKSGLVKTTGYIMAGAGALGALLGVGALLFAGAAAARGNGV